MNHRHRAIGLQTSILFGLALTLLSSSSAHAAEADGKANTQVDAIIPLVVLGLDKVPPAVNPDERGIHWSGVVLASQQVRPLDAIVIKESARNMTTNRPLLLALTGEIALDGQGRPATEGNSAQQTWCKDSVNPNASIDCYRDSDGDGKLDQRARGFLPRLEALSMNRVGAFESIETIAYRKAEPAELPLFNIDYLLCSATDSQITFARRIKKVGLLAGSSGGLCDNVASPAVGQTAGASDFLLDQARIRIRTENGARTALMTEGMPPGSIVGHVRTDRPITDIAHARRFSEQQEEALGELPDVYFAAAPRIAKEPVGIGETFFAAEVRHSITGTLHDPAIQLKVFKGNPNELIPAGAGLFGIRMRGTAESANLDANIVWCYPAPLNAPGNGAKCIAYDAMKIARVLDVWERFNLTRISIASSGPSIADPLIDRGEIDFGEPVLLEIAVEKIARKKIAIRASTDRQTERNKASRHLQIERADDGKGYVLVGQGILVLEPVDEQTIRVSEKIPVAAGSNADVEDFADVQRMLRRAR
jgi:hypothetical protein